jgi:hypothetical protein
MQILIAILLLRSASAAAQSIVWKDAKELGVGGQAFSQPVGGMLEYARLPPGAQGQVNGGEWSWSLSSAGLFVQFKSDSPAIYLNYTLRSAQQTDWPNFSPIGFSGCDLYAFDASSSAWRWVAVTEKGLSRAQGTTLVQELPLFQNVSSPDMPLTQWRLHFPSYNGVLALAVGVDAGSAFEADLSWNHSAPVFYVGTSITQGGLTPRPGDLYTSRLSRSLPTTVTNFGFCGSCQLEQPLARWISSAPRPPAALVIDVSYCFSPCAQLSCTGPLPFAQGERVGGLARASFTHSFPARLSPPRNIPPSLFGCQHTVHRKHVPCPGNSKHSALCKGCAGAGWGVGQRPHCFSGAH